MSTTSGSQVSSPSLRVTARSSITAVFEDPAQVGSTAGKGTYLWDGVAGTWFWIDPTNDMIFIGMVQRMMTAPGMPNLEDTTRALTYRALVEPEK